MTIPVWLLLFPASYVHMCYTPLMYQRKEHLSSLAVWGNRQKTRKQPVCVSLLIVLQLQALENFQILWIFSHHSEDRSLYLQRLVSLHLLYEDSWMLSQLFGEIMVYSSLTRAFSESENLLHCSDWLSTKEQKCTSQVTRSLHKKRNRCSLPIPLYFFQLHF